MLDLPRSLFPLNFPIKSYTLSRFPVCYGFNFVNHNLSTINSTKIAGEYWFVTQKEITIRFLCFKLLPLKHAMHCNANNIVQLAVINNRHFTTISILLKLDFHLLTLNFTVISLAQHASTVQPGISQEEANNIHMNVFVSANHGPYPEPNYSSPHTP
jgi:hypothetical protein